MVTNPKSLDEYLKIKHDTLWLMSATLLLFCSAYLGAHALQMVATRIGGKTEFWPAFWATLGFISMLVVIGPRSRPFRWLGAFWRRNIIGFTVCFDRNGDLYVLSNWEMRGLRSILPQSDGETIYVDLKGKSRDPFGFEKWTTSFGDCSNGQIDSLYILVHCNSSRLRLRPKEVFALYGGSSSWSLDSRVSDLLEKEKQAESMTKAYLKTHQEWCDLDQLLAISLRLHLQIIQMLKETKRVEKSKGAARIRSHLGSNLIPLLPQMDPAYDELVKEYGGKARA